MGCGDGRAYEGAPRSGDPVLQRDRTGTRPGGGLHTDIPAAARSVPGFATGRAERLGTRRRDGGPATGRAEAGRVRPRLRTGSAVLLGRRLGPGASGTRDGV